MKNIISVLLLTFFGVVQSCGNATPDTSTACKPNPVLDAAQFAKSINECPDAVVVDVRTPEEFEAGHIANALNININSQDFPAKIAALDKSKPVFVYCLSGGRSGAAAKHLRSTGFTTVADLQGGILKWKSAKLPLEQGAAAAPKPTGMTKESFEKILQSDKIVLVDFYAEWCQPCKKMAPYLEEIKNEMGQTVEVVRIDADKEPAIATSLNIEALPTLIIYKKGKSVWRNEGYVEKSDVVKKLNAAL